MKITELLKKDTIILDLKATSKAEVIDELVNKLDSAGRLNNKEDYKNAILKRESEFSTGIGDGIAIPHAKTAAVKTPALAFGRSVSGIDYDSLDGNPANIFFMIAASEGANSTHLETLSRLSTMLMNPDFKAKLLEAKSEDEILSLVDSEEEEKIEEESEDSVVEESEDSKGLVLAVTACPTGIAHTYMAADALKNKAKEMGVDIKVETNGSTGVKNKLTEDEINRASGIIVAADKKVEMARFDGKKVIQVPVVQGIKRPEELITQALNGDAPLYKHEGGSDSSDSAKGEKAGFYKHLMSGVSNMLPFVVGGGILIAISFMFGIKAYDPKDPSYNYIAKLLNDIGGVNAFALMVPVLAGFIGMSIADRPGFAPAMVGGLIADNNGAGFIGGLIAGFLGGYIVVLLKKVFAKLPQAFDGIKPVLIYPLLGILITGAIMFIVVIGPVNAFNLWLQNVLGSMGTANKIILGIILGGMMSIDMGGPINKAAFTFGIAMIASGNYHPHAAIMAGGMVPPLGIALATTFFKNRFNEQERNSGLTCYIMGLCFITEGAIPFAAADPGRVIPSAVVGSAITGGLTMLFNIGLPAPHGGVFVFGIVNGNPLLYLLAVIIGAIVTCLLLAILKKPIKENEVQA